MCLDPQNSGDSEFETSFLKLWSIIGALSEAEGEIDGYVNIGDPPRPPSYILSPHYCEAFFDV